MKHLKVIFMGTPDFAVPCLEQLQQNCDVIAVITQPDRPRGRGQKMMPSPVKVFAQAHNLPILQPEKIKTAEFQDRLAELKPDLIVVVAFGQLLSQAILDIPRLGCINVHASLLPRYRGAAPIHLAIINGETQSGVTTMFMDAGLDTGDMILKTAVPISDTMTTEQLHDVLMTAGAKLLLETVRQLAAGSAPRTKQTDEGTNYAPLLTKETGRIDWNKSAVEIHNLVRGLNSWPGAYTTLNGSNFKIWRTGVVGDKSAAAQVGEIVKITNQGFYVATGNGLLEILELQAPSKKKMAANDYIRGHGLALPARFE